VDQSGVVVAGKSLKCEVDTARLEDVLGMEPRLLVTSSSPLFSCSPALNALCVHHAIPYHTMPYHAWDGMGWVGMLL
jgi:hypothetical protein